MVPSISVITVTNRYGGIDVNWSSLRRQTFKDFEWILCDTLYEERKDQVREYVHDDRLRHIRQRLKETRAKTWLAHAENQAIKTAKGELIIFLQDYIHIDPQGLEKFWIQYEEDKKRMITGVGHQYGYPGKDDITNPKGLISIFTKPFEGVPEAPVWEDPRIKFAEEAFAPCIPNFIEFNYCAIPRQALFDIGGCDEEYDYVGHAYDNVSVALRAWLMGYKPYMDITNESKSIRHDDFFDTSVKVHDASSIIAFHNNRMEEIRTGKRLPKYNYL